LSAAVVAGDVEALDHFSAVVVVVAQVASLLALLSWRLSLLAFRLELAEVAVPLPTLLDQTGEIAFLILLLLSGVEAEALRMTAEKKDKLVVLEEVLEESQIQLSQEAVQQDKAMTGERALPPLTLHAAKQEEAGAELER